MLAGKPAEGDDVYSEPYSQLAPVQTATQPFSTSGSLDQPKRNSQTRKACRKVTKDRSFSNNNAGDQNFYSEAKCLPDDMGNSYSEPVGIYNLSSGSVTAGEFTPVNSGLPDRDVTHEREEVSYDLAKSSEPVPSRQQIQLGDYTEPPDRKTSAVGGIRRPKPEEYSDPYDTDKLLQAGREQKKEAYKLRHSAPTKASQDDLYELAQPIQNTAKHNSPSKGKNFVTPSKVPLHCTQSEGLTYDHVPNITGTSFDSGVETGAETGFEIPESELEEQDDYDHLSTWKGSNPSSPLKSPDYTQSQTLVVGEKAESPKMNTISSAFTAGGSSMSSPGQPGGRVEEVYAGAYEEPWDSKQSQQHFSKIVGKAESKYPESTDDRIIPGVVLRPKVKQPEVAVYEDAWDTEEKQKQFENKVKEAQRKQSGGVSQKSESEASTATYDEPWTDINCLRTTQPPKSSPGQPKRRSSPSSSPSHRPQQSLPPLNNPAHRPSQNLPGSSHASVPSEFESNTYESPWDTKKREQDLEDKVQKLRHCSPVNQRTVVDTPPPLSPGSPPNFFPPPPPTTQMYEEAWDMKRPSHLLAKSQPEGSRFSPNQNRMSEGSCRERAEPIDSGLPLDIQKFYHGSITRKEAEELMRIHKEGSYLVRRSETQKNVFSLSIKGIRGMPMHIRIGLSNGEYVLGENSQPFPTVPEVIDYYTRHELPVQNAGRLRLLYPIMRDKHAN